MMHLSEFYCILNSPCGRSARSRPSCPAVLLHPATSPSSRASPGGAATRTGRPGPGRSGPASRTCCRTGSWIGGTVERWRETLGLLTFFFRPGPFFLEEEKLAFPPQKKKNTMVRRAQISYTPPPLPPQCTCLFLRALNLDQIGAVHDAVLLSREPVHARGRDEVATGPQLDPASPAGTCRGSSYIKTSVVRVGASSFSYYVVRSVFQLQLTGNEKRSAQEAADTVGSWWPSVERFRRSYECASDSGVEAMQSFLFPFISFFPF